MATYPPSSPSTPPPSRSRVASPRPSPYLHPSPPRTTSLHNRSPRLGQSSFDASLDPPPPAAAGPPSYTASPRVLFPDPATPPSHHHPAASADTLHIISPGGGAGADKEPVQWQLGADDDGPQGRRRPPTLDLSSSNAPLAHLRYSTTSAVSKTGSDSSSSSTTPPAPSAATDPKRPSIRPSFRLLFSLTTRRTFWTIIFPALVCGIVSGLVPPFMTQMLGDAMQSFTDYATAIGSLGATHDIVSAANKTLMREMRDTAVKLTVAAAVVFCTSTTGLSLWVVHGERVAHELRLKVYRGITGKGIAWFDKGMGGAADGSEDKADAAGLMGRFTK